MDLTEKQTLMTRDYRHIRPVVHYTMWMLVAVAALTVAACGGSRTATGKSASQAAARNGRPPMTTTDEKLLTEAMLIDAKMKQETGRKDEARALYGKVLQRDAKNDAAYYESSILMTESGMIDSAIHYAQMAISNGKNNVWYKLHLATLYQYTGQNKKCIDVWEQIVKENPSVLNYYYELSNAYVTDGNIKGAISTLNRVEKMVGVSEEVSLQKAKLWAYEGRPDKELAEIEKLAEAMPNEVKLNGTLAETYMKMKEYDKAKMYYDRVLAADPNDEYIHISLADYYKAVGQPRKAYEELKLGFAQNKLSTKNKLQVLTNFYSNDEFYGIHSKYAFTLLDIIMQQSDDSTSYAAFYGDVLMRQKKYAKAAQQFELALTVDSSKYEVWEALLISEMQSESDTAQLRRDALRASSLFPLHPMPYYIQGVLAYDNKEYEEAVTLAKRCEQMGFSNGYLEAETYNLIAECYNRMDDVRSLEYYEKYLKLQPNDMGAMNSYAYRLAMENKELEKALAMSKQTIDAQPNNPYFRDTYAWILHLMGNDTEALKQIEAAVKMLKEEDEEIMKHLEVIKGK